jgi:hypothetical protein
MKFAKIAPPLVRKFLETTSLCSLGVRLHTGARKPCIFSKISSINCKKGYNIDAGLETEEGIRAAGSLRIQGLHPSFEIFENRVVQNIQVQIHVRQFFRIFETVGNGDGDDVRAVKEKVISREA